MRSLSGSSRKLASRAPTIPSRSHSINPSRRSHATKYSPAGREVSITSRANSEGVEMTVKDQGPGMPAELNGQPGSGTGLGLEIARQIAEMHGGRVWFESSPGRGTEFHFTLPQRIRPSRETAAVART